MEKWQASLALQNTIRENEKREKNLLKFCQKVLPESFGWQYEVKNLRDVLEAFNSIMKNDTFGYYSEPDSETGILYITITAEFKKINETRFEIKARLEAEEALYKDNQNKEDKVLVSLASIDNHTVQSRDEIRTLIKTVEKKDVPPESHVETDEYPVIFFFFLKKWITLSDYGKYDVVDGYIKNFFILCALEGYFRDGRLNFKIIDERINHGLSTKGRSNTLIKKIKAAEKTAGGRDTLEKERLDAQLKVIEKAEPVAEKFNEAVKNIVAAKKKYGIFDK
jgi:hypothetical protein